MMSDSIRPTGYRALSALMCAAAILGLGCTSDTPRRPERVPPRPATFEDMKPKASAGLQPAGTRDDPFVGDGVIMGIARARNKPPQLLVKHREIPYFMVAMQMTVYVAPPLITGLSEGDFVRLSFARADAAPAGLTTDQMWFGHELFRIEKLSDSSPSATLRHTTQKGYR